MSIVKGNPMLETDASPYNTIPELFDASTTKYADLPWLGRRKDFESPFEFTDHKTIQGRVHGLTKVLVKDLGLKKGDIVGICLPNGAEWIVMDQACIRAGIIPVGFFLNATPQNNAFIVKQTEMKVVVTFSRMLPLWLGMPLGLKTVICIDPYGADMAGLAQKMGIELKLMYELEAAGRALGDVSYEKPTPDDIWTIMYTSGTTGMPKGVVYTHRQILFHVKSEWSQTPLWECGTGTDDTHLSYMPMAHVFERYYTLKFMLSGGRVGFFSMDPLRIFEDLAALQATQFITVPMVLSAIHKRALGGLAQMPEQARGAFWNDFNNVKASIEKNGVDIEGKPKVMPQVSPVWEPFVSKMRASMGGKMRQISTGSAPLSADLKAFIKVVMGVRVIEGYGLTEHAIATSTHPLQKELGDVGIPYPGIEIKLEPAGDCDEILLKSEGLMDRYYKHTKKESKIDDDGWFHTGDAGEVTPEGNIKLLGRIDHMMKLSNGEYIVPDAIELDLKKSEYISEAFVYTKSEWSFVVALVEINPTPLIAWAKENSLPIKEGDMKALADHPIIRSFLQNEIRAIQTEVKARDQDLIKAITPMVPETLTKCWTPTRKLNRRSVMAQYESFITEVAERVTKGGRVEPKSGAEEEVIKAWTKVLGLEEAPPCDVNFFDIGGKSMYLLQLAEELKRIFGTEIKVEKLLIHTTVETQAEWLESL